MWVWSLSAGSDSLLESMGTHVAGGHQVGEVDPSHGHHVAKCLPHFIGIACSIR